VACPYTLFHWILFFLSFGALFVATIFVTFTCHDNWALALTNQTTIELSAIGWAESSCKSKGQVRESLFFVMPLDLIIVHLVRRLNFHTIKDCGVILLKYLVLIRYYG
jgi:hypothetical protein